MGVTGALIDMLVSDALEGDQRGGCIRVGRSGCRCRQLPHRAERRRARPIGAGGRVRAGSRRDAAAVDDRDGQREVN